MADIYQEIWDADQSGSGVEALLDHQEGNHDEGFAKVNSNLDERSRELQVITEAVIPESKMRTYGLCKEVFNNYALAERDLESDTDEERQEAHDLVHSIVDSAPMQVAREYVASVTNSSITRERWYNTIMDHWFRRFSQGGDPHLTGFEHVVVGEQEGAKAQGYHFWYKYYLDDGFAHEADDGHPAFVAHKDRIAYLGSKQKNGQHQFPESVTISYRWNAPDYERNELRPLTKKIGGFFVGCSVEGLLALGTLRAHLGAQAPKIAEINGARYNLKVFRSSNNRHIRTFYPVFLGETEGIDIGGGERGGDGGVIQPMVASKVRIIAALINPEGHDPGRESVTLINTGSEQWSLDGWRLQDKNIRNEILSGITLNAGDTVRITLDPSGAQLSNKGGRISLIDEQGRIVHAVTYSKGQARSDGETIIL